MGKRSNYTRRKEDAYDTPDRAIRPLLPHLAPNTRYFEPCAGQGDLILYLRGYGHNCVGALDIAPRTPPDRPPTQEIAKGDATKFVAADHYYGFDCFITNPPWTRDILHDVILNLYWQKPTWLLFDSDWKHTQQAKPYLPLIEKEVSVGRVKWIAGSKDYSKDNCSWYLFHGQSNHQFIGRHF